MDSYNNYPLSNCSRFPYKTTTDFKVPVNYCTILNKKFCDVYKNIQYQTMRDTKASCVIDNLFFMYLHYKITKVLKLFIRQSSFGNVFFYVKVNFFQDMKTVLSSNNYFKRVFIV